MSEKSNGSTTGLSSTEVLARRKQYCKNSLPQEKTKSVWTILINQLKSPLVYIILVAALVCPYWVVSEFHEAMLDKYGIARGKQGRAIYTKQMMSAERCAEITLKAAY